MPDDLAVVLRKFHRPSSSSSLITLMLRPMTLPSLSGYLSYLRLSCLIWNHISTPPRTMEDITSNAIAQAPPGATTMSLVALSISVIRSPSSGGVGVDGDVDDEDDNDAHSASSSGLANALTLSTNTSESHNSESHPSILDVNTSPLYTRRKAYPEGKAVNACCGWWVVALISCTSMSTMLALMTKRY